MKKKYITPLFDFEPIEESLLVIPSRANVLSTDPLDTNAATDNTEGHGDGLGNGLFGDDEWAD